MKIRSWQAETALILGMAISVFCAGFCDFTEEYSGITDTVFRLHIPANSDSAVDQALKLKVRDAVLEGTSDIFENCGSASEAADAARENIGLIRGIAEKALRENGCSYDVRCEVAEMDFDRRVYDRITMPAGRYSALRISIGTGEGKNWWCVMFPPLCIPAASDVDEAMEEYGGLFTEEELDMLYSPEKYECKFYFLELLEKIENFIAENDSSGTLQYKKVMYNSLKK